MSSNLEANHDFIPSYLFQEGIERPANKVKQWCIIRKHFK